MAAPGDREQAELEPAMAVPADQEQTDCSDKAPVEEAVMMVAAPWARDYSLEAAERMLPVVHCLHNCSASRTFWDSPRALPDLADCSAIANSYYSSGLPLTSLLYSPGLTLPLSLSSVIFFTGISRSSFFLLKKTKRAGSFKDNSSHLSFLYVISSSLII